jgi:FixJ family two-component response regulator
MTQQNHASRVIYLVDDDAGIRDTLSIILSGEGYQVVCFADGAALLAAARNKIPACIFIDVHIPGKSGLDVLKELHAEDYPAPIFIISGQGDIAMAVTAIKNGALDFIEKPFRSGAIVARVREAIAAFANRPSSDGLPSPQSLNFPGREPLTRREREILALFTAGDSNKEAGRKLGISPRTIEGHRASIMKKLGARNAADLVRIVVGAGRGS